jgi:hypothetical protein
MSHDFYIYTHDICNYRAASCQDMQPSSIELTNKSRLHLI